MCLKFEKFEALCAYKPRAYKKKKVYCNTPQNGLDTKTATLSFVIYAFIKRNAICAGYCGIFGAMTKL